MKNKFLKIFISAMVSVLCFSNVCFAGTKPDEINYTVNRILTSISEYLKTKYNIDVGDINYTIVTGNSTSVKSPIKIESLPKDYTSDMAIKNGDYVDVHGNISNENVMNEFLEKISKNQSAFLRKVQFTIEGDPIITDFLYNNGVFTVISDTTRDKFGSGEITTKNYKNLTLYDDGQNKYYFVTNLEKITKADFDSGFDGVILK